MLCRSRKDALARATYQAAVSGRAYAVYQDRWGHWRCEPWISGSVARGGPHEVIKPESDHGQDAVSGPGGGHPQGQG